MNALLLLPCFALNIMEVLHIRVCNYLGGKADLTLAKLRRIMRSHYQDNSNRTIPSVELNCPAAKEKSQEFLIRLLDMKQKVLFASQETDSELKYDPTFVHGMFVHSVSLGLQNENREK